MDTFKNILLGFLIGIIIWMGSEIYSLKQQISNKSTHNVTQDPIVIFEKFFDLVLELEEKKQQQMEKNNVQ